MSRPCKPISHAAREFDQWCSQDEDADFDAPLSRLGGSLLNDRPPALSSFDFIMTAGNDAENSGALVLEMFRNLRNEEHRVQDEVARMSKQLRKLQTDLSGVYVAHTRLAFRMDRLEMLSAKFASTLRRKIIDDDEFVDDRPLPRHLVTRPPLSRQDNYQNEGDKDDDDAFHNEEPPLHHRSDNSQYRDFKQKKTNVRSPPTSNSNDAVAVATVGVESKNSMQIHHNSEAMEKPRRSTPFGPSVTTTRESPDLTGSRWNPPNVRRHPSQHSQGEGDPPPPTSTVPTFRQAVPVNDNAGVIEEWIPLSRVSHLPQADDDDNCHNVSGEDAVEGLTSTSDPRKRSNQAAAKSQGVSRKRYLSDRQRAEKESILPPRELPPAPSPDTERSKQGHTFAVTTHSPIITALSQPHHIQLESSDEEDGEIDEEDRDIDDGDGDDEDDIRVGREANLEEGQIHERGTPVIVLEEEGGAGLLETTQNDTFEHAAKEECVAFIDENTTPELPDQSLLPTRTNSPDLSSDTRGLADDQMQKKDSLEPDPKEPPGPPGSSWNKGREEMGPPESDVEVSEI